MIFNHEKWPTLFALSENMGHEEFINGKLGEVGYATNKDNYNEAANEELWQLIKDNSDAHYYITEPVRKIVDVDEKAIDIIEKQIYNPEYESNFTGTISYVSPERDLPKSYRNVTGLVSFFNENKKQYFMLALYIGSPAIYMGTIAGRKHGKEFQVVDYYGIDANFMLGKLNFFEQFLFFINHCTEKTKFVVGGEQRRIKTPGKEKFLNDINLPIEIIDSSFYTKIVRKDAFKVHGHWRYQAHGPKMQKRKLKWINDFEKKGYVRKTKLNGR